jgi:Na+-transporting NADH:ubiquinone oxidoreductase subunit NqrE
VKETTDDDVEESLAIVMAIMEGMITSSGEHICAEERAYTYILRSVTTVLCVDLTIALVIAFVALVAALVAVLVVTLVALIAARVSLRL